MSRLNPRHCANPDRCLTAHALSLVTLQGTAAMQQIMHSQQAATAALASTQLWMRFAGRPVCSTWGSRSLPGAAVNPEWGCGNPGTLWTLSFTSPLAWPTVPLCLAALSSLRCLPCLHEMLGHSCDVAPFIAAAAEMVRHARDVVLPLP